MSEYPAGTRVKIVTYGYAGEDSCYVGLEGTVRVVYHRDSSKTEPYHHVHLDDDPDDLCDGMILCLGNEIEEIS